MVTGGRRRRGDCERLPVRGSGSGAFREGDIPTICRLRPSRINNLGRDTAARYTRIRNGLKYQETENIGEAIAPDLLLKVLLLMASQCLEKGLAQCGFCS